MRHNAQRAQSNREPIHDQKENLNSNDAIYQPEEQFLRKDRVFFDKLGEVVQSGSYKVECISLRNSTFIFLILLALSS